MALLNEYTPISRLNRDVLWKIFSIISDSMDILIPTQFPPFDPLTNMRQTSQVCTLWRCIILESSSLWGNCIDLDLLRQKDNKWRHEILRRTGNALLTVRARNPLIHDPDNSDGLQKFTIDIISNDWERLKSLDIAIMSPETLNTPHVWNSFRRPAPYLRVFSIRNATPGFKDGSGFMSFPPGSRLFAENSPSLTYFSIGSSIFSTSSLVPFPSIFLTGRLRHLTLDQPLVISAPDLLAACTQMPLLEEFSIEIMNLTVENPRNPGSTSSIQLPVSLPNLRMIYIYSECLDVYPEFLGRITPHSGCRWDVYANVTPRSETPPKTLELYGEEIQHTIVRYMSSFFAEHSTGPSCPTYLLLSLDKAQIILSAHREKNCFADAFFQTVFHGHILSLLVIRKFFVRALLSLNYPPSLLQFQFALTIPSTIIRIPPLAPFFLALESTKELHITPEGLRYIIAQSEAEGHIFFRSLDTVFLMELGITRDAAQQIKPFFVNRQHVAPVKVLNITMVAFGDLRPLDEIMGLKIIRRRGDSVSDTIEYVCGCDSPEQLIVG